MKRFCLTALLIMLLPISSLATTWYVAKPATGNDSNNCTQAQNPATPKATITAALACIGTGAGAGAGHTVEVAVGTYVETFSSNIPKGTSWGSPFTLQAKTGDVVTIRGTGGNGSNFSISGEGNMYSIIKGFVVDGANLSGSNPGNIIIFSSSYLRLLNLEIINTQIWNGVYMFSGFNEVIGCTIHGGTMAPVGFGHGIYVESSDNLIEGNELYSLNAFGIHLYSSSGNLCNRNVIRKNKVHSFGLNRGTADGILLASGDANQAYNNIVYDGALGTGNGGRGIGIWGSNNKVYNNTIYNNTEYGIYQQGATGSIIRNNIVYSNGSNFSGTGGTLSNNITANPLFVSAGTDFHLSAGSPAINAGCTDAVCGTTITSIFTTDYDAVSRGSQPWDAGAFEYAAGGGDSITLVTPNGGNSWTIGSPQTITWTTVGTFSGIDIKLDRDNNGTFEDTLATNTANDGSFDWTVAGAASTTVKIQVCKTASTPCDVSDAVFSITSSGGGGLTKRISNNTFGTKVGDISGTDDTYLSSLDPTGNYDSDPIMYVGKVSAADHSHGLLRFSGLSQIPSGATVTSVTLGLFKQDSNGVTNQTIDLRRVLRTWSETQATWNSYSTGNSWTTAGGLGAATDRVSTAVGSMTGISETNQYFTLTDSGSGGLKDFVQNIVSGSAANEGLHLEDTTEGDGYRGFTARNGTDGQRPYLEVTYTTSTSTITVTEPKTNDLFLSGQSGPCRWTSQGISGNVKIDISRDGGTTWENLFASVPFDSADTTLTYLAPTSSNCKVRVVALDGTNTTGTSGAFRIGGTRAGFLLVP